MLYESTVFVNMLGPKFYISHKSTFSDANNVEYKQKSVEYARNIGAGLKGLDEKSIISPKQLVEKNGVNHLENSQGKYKKSQKTISKIIEVTQKLLEEKGFVNVTIRDICKAANISTGSFYSHFNSKEELMATIFTNIETGHKEFQRRAITHGSCKERLFSFVKQYAWINMSNTPEELKIILGFQNPIYKTTRHWIGLVEGILIFGITSGEICTTYSAHELADMLMICLRGCSNEWCRQNGEYDLEVQMLNCTQLLFSSLWQNPEPDAAALKKEDS